MSHGFAKNFLYRIYFSLFFPYFIGLFEKNPICYFFRKGWDIGTLSK